MTDATPDCQWFMDDNLRKQTAIHEAAHAVALWLVALPFNHVTIAPEDRADGNHSAGHVRTGQQHESICRALMGCARPEELRAKNVRTEIDAWLVVLLCGMFSELYLGGMREAISIETYLDSSFDENGDFNPRDYEQFERLIRCTTSPRSQRRRRADAERRAAAIVCESWAHIEAIAYALLERGLLDRTEVAELIRSPIDNANNKIAIQ